MLAWWPLVIADFCLIVGLPVFAAWKLEQKARRMFVHRDMRRVRDDERVEQRRGGFRGRRRRAEQWLEEQELVARSRHAETDAVAAAAAGA